MDFLAFIAKLVEALAWPMVVAYALWLVRDRLGALLGRLEKFKGWGAEADFGKGLDKVEDRLPNPPPASSGVETPETNSFALVDPDVPPAYFVQRQWIRIEQALLEAATKRNIAVDGQHPRNLNLIAKHLGLPKDTYEILNNLRRLRNEAVHAPEANISQTDALRYRDLANSVIGEIGRLSGTGLPK